MSDAVTLERLLVETATLSAAIDALVALGPNAFELQMADGSVTLAEFDPALARLMLSREIGQAPEARRAKVYATLLAYNALWAETGGVRAAVTADDAAILLMVDVFVFGHDAGQLARIIDDLVAKADLWAAYVAADAEVAFADLPGNEAVIRI